jgi:hypothetical protein
MAAAANYPTLAGRVLLFVVLPFGIWFGLELLVPLSMIITGPLFFPFVAHPFKEGPGTWSEALFANAPWSYVANGAFVALVAVLTAAAGRRRALWTNLLLFVGVVIPASVVVHLILVLFGFPYRVDAP